MQEYRLVSDTRIRRSRERSAISLVGGDALNINVWKEPPLGGSLKVRPDGFITLPLLNEVQLVGLTTEQLRKMLQEKCKEYRIDPFVTIRVEGIASSEVFLVGQPNGPGAYPLAGNDTILQLLTRTGDWECLPSAAM